MKVKKKVLYEFLLAYICAILTIILFYKSNGINNGTYFISFLDALLKTITTFLVLSMIEKESQNTYLTGTVVFLISVILYNQNAIFKYAVESLYDGSISDNFLRFWGAFYVDIIIVVSTVVWRKYHRRNALKKNNLNNRFEDIHINLFIVYLLTSVFLIAEIYSVARLGVVWEASGSRTMKTIIAAIEYVTYTVVTLNVKTKDGKIVLRSMIPIALIGGCLLYASAITGGKHYFLQSMLAICCALLFQEKIRFTLVKYMICLSPIVLQVLTSLSELTSGRFGSYDSYWVLRYHAFRYDLSDFTITIASRFSKIQNSFSVIQEGVDRSIPRFLLSGKSDTAVAYNQNLSYVGLDGYNMDYNDTLFSVGAQIGGYVGIFFLFLLVLIFFEWISKKIISIKKIGLLVMLTFLEYFSKVDYDWFMFCYYTRDLLIYLLIGYAFFKVFTKVKKTSV